MAKSLAERVTETTGLKASRGSMSYIDPLALTVVTDKTHPLYDPRVEEPLDAGFLEGIKANGVLVPVIYRSNGTDDDGRPVLEVVAGRRRVLHALEANRIRATNSEPPILVPIIAAPPGGDETMVLTALRENVREDETVRSKAHKIQSALKLGASEKDVCIAANVSAPTMKNFLAYLGLTPDVQRAIDEGQVPLGSIQVFADVPREKQREVLEQVKTSGASKNHEVKEAVKAARNGESYTPPDRAKVYGRRAITWMKGYIDEVYDNKESRLVAAALGLALGDDRCAAEHEALKGALASWRKRERKTGSQKEKEG